MKSATATIPVVFVAVADPVGLGLVQGLSHPGGNITGLTTVVPGDFFGKQIEILRELVPGASKIALLVNPDNQMHRLSLAEDLPRAARNLGVTLAIVEATTAEELDIAFVSAAAQRADAIDIFVDYLTVRQAPRVIALSAKHHQTAIYFFRQFTDGGLVVYRPDVIDLFRRPAGYVGKVLKGAKLPIC